MTILYGSLSEEGKCLSVVVMFQMQGEKGEKVRKMPRNSGMRKIAGHNVEPSIPITDPLVFHTAEAQEWHRLCYVNTPQLPSCARLKPECHILPIPLGAEDARLCNSH